MPSATLAWNMLPPLPGPRPATRSELLGRRHAVDERPHAALADREHDVDEALERGGVVEPAGVDRLVAGVAVQLLDDLARLVVAAPEVARGRARFAEPVVERREVDVERLRRRPVGPRLDELGARREAGRRICADQ